MGGFPADPADERNTGNNGGQKTADQNQPLLILDELQHREHNERQSQKNGRILPGEITA